MSRDVQEVLRCVCFQSRGLELKKVSERIAAAAWTSGSGTMACDG